MDKAAFANYCTCNERQKNQKENDVYYYFDLISKRGLYISKSILSELIEDPGLEFGVETNLGSKLYIEYQITTTYAPYHGPPEGYDNYYEENDNSYCGACGESPCRCSDPERTSTL